MNTIKKITVVVSTLLVISLSILAWWFSTSLNYNMAYGVNLFAMLSLVICAETFYEEIKTLEKQLEAKS